MVLTLSSCIMFYDSFFFFFCLIYPQSIKTNYVLIKSQCERVLILFIFFLLAALCNGETHSLSKQFVFIENWLSYRSVYITVVYFPFSLTDQMLFMSALCSFLTSVDNVACLHEGPVEFHNKP